MIHQDIKLENIFHNVLTGEVKIGDFGFAILLKDVYSVEVAGTEGYMAPELKMDPPERGTFNDIYSVTISFIRLLTGDNDTPQEDIEKLLNEKIENEKIRNILRRGIDKDNKTRATAQELLDLIEESY